MTPMKTSIKIIDTDAENWLQQCQKWAEEKSVFEIHGIQSKDFEFCRSLCSFYDYSYKYKMSGEQFVAVLCPREKS